MEIKVKCNRENCEFEYNGVCSYGGEALMISRGGCLTFELRIADELNGYSLIDIDSCQYGKKISDTEYSYIQCEEYPNSVVVRESTIELGDYAQDDMESSVSRYYDSIEEMKVQYPDCYNQIIAECIFEQEQVLESGGAWEFDTVEGAESFIREWISIQVLRNRDI